jgi:hypothetical protein
MPTEVPTDMATEPQNPSGVYLVGSIGLDTVEDVFRTVGALLGPHLQRVPDGEVGGRRLWISWQYPLLRSMARARSEATVRALLQIHADVLAG